MSVITTVVEALNSTQGNADREGVVPVHAVGVTLETSLDPLDS
ncbi:hypothetical protein [Chromohalobacter sp. 296-RDG]|nr:hypothetical protein [Chromohalobacter sp. 296-RDG]